MRKGSDALRRAMQGEPVSLGALPLTVLTSAKRWPEGWPVWSVLQDELAALSADSVHMSAVNAGHNVHLDDPEVVVQAIRELIRRTQ